MSITKTPVVGAAAVFLAIVLLGFWLSYSGKPYGTAALTGHKLLSLGAVVWLGITAHRMNQAATLGAAELLAVAAASLFFLGTMVTGSLLAIKAMPTPVLRLHQVTPYLTIVFSAAALFLLSRR